MDSMDDDETRSAGAGAGTGADAGAGPHRSRTRVCGAGLVVIHGIHLRNRDISAHITQHSRAAGTSGEQGGRTRTGRSAP